MLTATATGHLREDTRTSLHYYSNVEPLPLHNLKHTPKHYPISLSSLSNRAGAEIACLAYRFRTRATSVVSSALTYKTGANSMATQTAGGTPPNITMTPPKPQGKNQRTPSGAQGKRNNRNNPRKQNHHVDGAVSDSMATAPPHSKKNGRQGQGGHQHYNNGQNGDTGNQRMRPVSVGGPLLPGTPAKERAYAQSTFQASPAASALPVPKFFGSKSVPSTHGPSSLQERMDREKTPERLEESSPESDVVSPAKVPHSQNETPLDLFFMADKAEKERKNSPGAGISPQLAARPPPASEPRNPFHTNMQSPFVRPSNETNRNIVSPRPASIGQRPPVPRAHSSPGNNVNGQNQSNGNHDASTQALKDLLFSNINKQSSTPPHSHQRAPSNPNAVDSVTETPSPVQQRSALGPSTPTPAKNSHDQHSLHYGNRNLSPMFQAARNETPPRPSNLRQQLEHSGQQNGFPQYNQQPYLNYADPNSFSRSYLDHQIRSSLPTQPPSGLISNGNGNNAHSSTSSSGPTPPQKGMPIPGAASSSPRNGGSRDVKGMEDDLRRMLKLDVLG